MLAAFSFSLHFKHPQKKTVINASQYGVELFLTQSLPPLVLLTREWQGSKAL